MMSASVSEQDARRAAEQSRETEWTHESFGKRLYLGEFQPQLVWPHPGDEPGGAPTLRDERGEQYLADLSQYLREHVDGTRIENEDRISDEVLAGLNELGSFGIKIPTE